MSLTSRILSATIVIIALTGIMLLLTPLAHASGALIMTAFLLGACLLFPFMLIRLALTDD